MKTEPGYSNPKNWSLVELARGTPSLNRVQREKKAAEKAALKRKLPRSRMTVNDMLVLAAAGGAVLKTNTALKGDRRRMLRTAVNRAIKHVENMR